MTPARQNSAARTVPAVADLRIASTVLAPESRISPAVMAGTVQSMGFTRIHITDVNELQPKNRNQPLRELADAVESAGMSCTLGAQFITSTHRARNPILAHLAGDSAWANGLVRLIEHAQAAGIHRLLALVGHAEDRLRGAAAWRDQLDDAIQTLRFALPAMRDTGTTIMLKLHPDINTGEVLRLIDSTDPSLVRVAFDPVNVVTRGENPIEAAEQLREFIDVVAIDDMIMVREPHGCLRVPVAFGSGTIPWEALTRILPQNAEHLVDLKRVSIPIPYRNPDWCAAQGWTDPVQSRRNIERNIQVRDDGLQKLPTPLSFRPLVYQETWERREAALRALATFLQPSPS